MSSTYIEVDDQTVIDSCKMLSFIYVLLYHISCFLHYGGSSHHWLFQTRPFKMPIAILHQSRIAVLFGWTLSTEIMILPHIIKQDRHSYRNAITWASCLILCANAEHNVSRGFEMISKLPTYKTLQHRTSKNKNKNI